MEYDMHFLQAENNWNKEFSFDDQGLLLEYILFGIVFLLGFGVHLFGDYQLFRARSFHPIMRLLTISIALTVFSLWFYLGHYAIYSNNGVGSTFLRVLGAILDSASGLVFIFLLILISKGWGITYPSIAHFQEQKIPLIIILSLFFVMYVVLFFCGEFATDPASTLYIYQSIPGIIFIVVRFLVTVYFVFCLVKTVRDDTDSSKRIFYTIFGTGYLLWFLSLPIIVMIASALAPWVRQKIVMGIYLLCTTLGFAIISFLLWPSRASKYFAVAVPDLMSGHAYDRL